MAKLNLVVGSMLGAAEYVADHVASLLEQKSLTSTFMATYLGDATGHFTIRPDVKMPDGFDPRVRPWYKGAESSSTSTLTEPYIDAATGQYSNPIPAYTVLDLFANYRISTVKSDVGFNKKVTRALGSGARVMHTEERPAFLAKNRYGLPDTLPLSWAEFMAAMPQSE